MISINRSRNISPIIRPVHVHVHVTLINNNGAGPTFLRIFNFTSLNAIVLRRMLKQRKRNEGGSDGSRGTRRNSTSPWLTFLLDSGTTSGTLATHLKIVAIVWSKVSHRGVVTIAWNRKNVIAFLRLIFPSDISTRIKPPFSLSSSFFFLKYIPFEIHFREKNSFFSLP